MTCRSLLPLKALLLSLLSAGCGQSELPPPPSEQSRDSRSLAEDSTPETDSSASQDSQPAPLVLPDFQRIAAGSFEMGCTPEQERSGFCDWDEEPVRTVTLTRDFYLSATEITQDQYQSLMGENPAYFYACGGDCPVESVSWYQAARYANTLSELEGLEGCYACSGEGKTLSCEGSAEPYACEGYRLPTEAEWEFAARCGESTLYAGSNSVHRAGWYWDNSNNTTHPVAQKSVNACGLYDMSGNVWEWVEDWYDSGFYEHAPSEDPVNTTEAGDGMHRGGGWASVSRYLRVSDRDIDDRDFQDLRLGFRLARSAD